MTVARPIVLETRQTPEGFTRRRYEHLGDRYTTIEVPLEVWQALNSVGRARNRVEQWLRARDRESTRKQAVSLCRAGRTRKEIASLLSVPCRTVYQWTQGPLPP